MNLQNSNSQETRKRNFSTFFFQIFVYFCRFWKNLFFCKISVLKNVQKKIDFSKTKNFVRIFKNFKEKSRKIAKFTFFDFSERFTPI
jgi:hypothetical protein